MAALIEQDPEEALRRAVPRRIYRELPEAITQHLETPINARGDFLVTVACHSRTADGADSAAEEVAGGRGQGAGDRQGGGTELPKDGRPVHETQNAKHEKPSDLRRTVQIGDDYYEAFVLGKREATGTKFGMPIHGIALDRKIALQEEPWRSLEDWEKAAAELSDEAIAARVGDGIVVFDSVEEARAKTHRLAAAAEEINPYAFYGAGESATASDAGDPAPTSDHGSSWTMGTQPVLVIRVDFEDMPGDPMTFGDIPVTKEYAQELMDTEVGPFFEAMSYTHVALPATVTDLYRMPYTAEDYGNQGQLTDNDLHRHAREAAAADHELADYSRIVVVFSRLAYMYIGKAQLGGPYAWINGSFTTKIVAHEFGHTFGLHHAGDYEGPGGETGDPFDVMGLGHPPDGHFNVAFKRRLEWLPESSVKTVTESGVYRVHRFDHPDANFEDILALRVQREGAQYYWIGMRQNFHDRLEGAVVLYTLIGGKTVLAPINLYGDLSLRLGQTYSSFRAPVEMTALARGGEYPHEWLDVEITITPPDGPVIAWGRSDFGQTDIPKNLGDVVDIAAGGHNSVAILADGTIRLWGELAWGLDEPPSDLGNVRKVAISPRHALALTHDGTIATWGSNAYDLQQIPSELYGAKVVDVAVGDFHSLALREDGRVIAWGHNMFGESTPPEDLADGIAVAAGYYRSLALTGTGTVVAWGRTSASVSLPPDSLADAVAISGTGTNFLALRADGTVVRWGSDHQDALPPADLSDVTAIAAGSGHSLALNKFRELTVWGTNNWSGQLNAPNWARRGHAVAAGQAHSLLLRQPPIPFNTWSAAANLPADLNAPWDDPDGDERPNLIEYALGTDPMRASTAGGPTLSRTENGGHVFRFFRPDYVTGITYHLQASEDLVHWTEVPAAAVESAVDGEIWDAVFPPNAGRQFARLRVEMD